MLANAGAGEEGGVGFYDGVVGDGDGVVDCSVRVDLDVGADDCGVRGAERWGWVSDGGGGK